MTQRRTPPALLPDLPLFRDTPEAEWPQLLLLKVKACPFAAADYYTLGYDTEGKVKRQRYLEETTDLLGKRPELLTRDLHEPIINLFTGSALKTLPPPTNPSGAEFDPEEDEPVPCPTWPAISLIYLLFFRLLDSARVGDSVPVKRLIGMPLVCRLLAVFDSEDPREREVAKTCLHRIYGKFLQLRAPIRRAIQARFQETLDSGPGQKFNLSELLEILGSIVNGFATPLREEHKLFLKRSLLPLHKLPNLSMFYPQLAYCVVQYVEKDPSLAATPVIDSLLRYWPRSNSVKEVLFLTEIEEILDIAGPEEFSKCRDALFLRLSACIRSSHFQVAERALTLWSGNEYVLRLLASDPTNLRAVLPTVLSALEEASKRHWNRNVQALALAATTTLMQLDPVLYEEARRGGAPPTKPMLELGKEDDMDIEPAPEPQSGHRSKRGASHDNKSL